MEGEASEGVRLFGEVTEALLAEGGTESARMFGSDGIKVNGKVFAMEVRERLVVKLPKDRVDALADSGEGVPFDPGHGRIMKEWVSIAASSAERWLELSREARQFVDGRSRRR